MKTTTMIKYDECYGVDPTEGFNEEQYLIISNELATIHQEQYNTNI